VAGAVLVLLVGSVRIAQLRLATWRHRREPARPGSTAVTPAHEAQPVESQGDAHETRP
jgi:hypothetical protein